MYFLDYIKHNKLSKSFSFLLINEIPKCVHHNPGLILFDFQDHDQKTLDLLKLFYRFQYVGLLLKRTFINTVNTEKSATTIVTHIIKNFMIFIGDALILYKVETVF